MTALIVIREIVANSISNGYYIGCDSLTASSYHIKGKVKEPKFIFRKAGFAEDALNIAIGVSGCFRMVNVIRRIAFPKVETTPWCYLEQILIARLRERLLGEKWSESGDHPWELLVVFGGQVFTVNSETLEVVPESGDHCVAGSAAEVMLGSLHTSDRLRLEPKNKLLSALEAASDLHLYAAPPYSAWYMPMTGEVKTAVF